MLKCELTPKEQVFRYAYEGRVIFIAMDRLIRSLAKKSPIIEVDVMQEIALRLIKNRSVDDLYVHKYIKDFENIKSGKHVPMPPGVVIWFKDGTWELADGNNRYVAAFMAGVKKFRVWEAKRQQWAPFIIHDMQEDTPHGDPIILA